jgi:hypothetical protein
MAKRKRKSLTPRRGKKQPSKGLRQDSIQDNETNDIDEAWILNELVSIEDLKTENSPSCDSEGCNNKALYVYQGQVTKSRWNSCIDCQLKDYTDWPSIEEFKDASEDIPFTIEMEQIVRKECMNDSNMILPSYLSRSRLDNPLVTVELNETPPLNETNNASNSDDISESIESNSVATLIIPEEDLDCNFENNETETINGNETETNQSNNEPDVNPKSRKKRKSIQRNEFCHEMKMLEKKGILKLDPKVMNTSTNKPHEKGLYITCIICLRFRTCTDGLINLRRPYYEYYYFKHAEQRSHKIAKALFDSRDKIKKKDDSSKPKSYTQSMISSFMVTKVTKTTTNKTPRDNSNQMNTTNTAASTIPTNGTPNDDQQCVNIETTNARER